MSRLFGSVIALGALVAAVPPGGAIDFEPMSLDRLIRAADLVVVGRVASATEDRFTLQVIDPIAAPDTAGSVTIKRNKDWSGAGGTSLYRDGQRMLVFAEETGRDAAADGPRWRVLGFENEGALPIEREDVYYAGGALEFLEAETYDLDGLVVTAYRFRLPDFVDIVELHRACFGRAPARNEAESAPSGPLCSDPDLEQLREKAPLGPYLIRQAERG